MSINGEVICLCDAKMEMSASNMKQAAETIWLSESCMLYAPGTNTSLVERTIHYHCHTALQWLHSNVKYSLRQEHHTSFVGLANVDLDVKELNESLEVSLISPSFTINVLLLI